ncbi:hypothetical protein [Pedobacter faecalis]|uniref:hypothetical protein n=1 Tax=Pedobacter faecalis TaxID=3041495 RepID=UPI00254ABB48|nr:hypothetical protein [Pedobacter sp. ELA7]
MKKLLNILLLTFYVFFCTELRELTKLPVLFQHYFEHKSLDNSISFLSYLEHHYGCVPHTDDDEERDNQLPFKTPDMFSGKVLTSTPPPSNSHLLRVDHIVLDQAKRLSNDHIPHSSYAGKIWQPPKGLILS